MSSKSKATEQVHETTIVEPETAPEAKAPAKPGAGIAKTVEDQNPWGIKNQYGVLTRAHINKMLSYYLMGPVFKSNRRDNFAYFTSDAFLSQHRGETIVQVAKAAGLDPRWQEPDRPAPAKTAKKVKAPKIPAEFGAPELQSVEQDLESIRAFLESARDAGLVYGLSACLANALSIDLLAARELVVKFLSQQA